MNIQPKVVPEKRDERGNGSASVTAAAGPQQRVWMMRTSDSAPWQPCPSPMTLEEQVVPPATTGAAKTALRPNTSNFIMAKNLVDTTSFLNVVDKTYEDYLAEDTETDGLTDADEEAGTDEDETDETGEPEAKKRARPATKPGTTKGTGGQN